MPLRRIFFRHTALIFLEIHKVFLRQIALSGEKISRPFGIFGCEYRFLLGFAGITAKGFDDLIGLGPLFLDGLGQ